MLGEVTDIPAMTSLKLDEQFIGTPDALGERPVSHCPSDLNVPALVSEIEHLAPDFDVRDIFAIVSLTLHGTLPSEQRENEPKVVTKRNPVTVSDGLTRREFNWNDFARSAAPLPGDCGSSGEPGKEMTGGYGELQRLASGNDLDADNATFDPIADRLFDKNDSILHASNSPPQPERETVWAGVSARNVNGVTKSRLMPRCCLEAA